MRNVTINDNIPPIIGIIPISPNKKLITPTISHIINTLNLLCQKTLTAFLTPSIADKSSMTTA